MNSISVNESEASVLEQYVIVLFLSLFFYQTCSVTLLLLHRASSLKEEASVKLI